MRLAFFDFPIKSDYRLAIQADVSPKHARCVEDHGKMTFAVQHDHPAFSSQSRHFFQCPPRTLFHRKPLVLDHRVDVMGYGQADEIFPMAGGRNRTTQVVGIRSGPNDRRITDPAGPLFGDPSCRSPGR